VLDSLVKVKDAANGKLKRWETPSGKTLAVKRNDGSLILTELGKKLGYRTTKEHRLIKG
jgi:hypothetical protein